MAVAHRASSRRRPATPPDSHSTRNPLLLPYHTVRPPPPSPLSRATSPPVLASRCPTFAVAAAAAAAARVAQVGCQNTRRARTYDVCFDRQVLTARCGEGPAAHAAAAAAVSAARRDTPAMPVPAHALPHPHISTLPPALRPPSSFLHFLFFSLLPCFLSLFPPPTTASSRPMPQTRDPSPHINSTRLTSPSHAHTHTRSRVAPVRARTPAAAPVWPPWPCGGHAPWAFFVALASSCVLRPARQPAFSSRPPLPRLARSPRLFEPLRASLSLSALRVRSHKCTRASQSQSRRRCACRRALLRFTLSTGGRRIQRVPAASRARVRVCAVHCRSCGVSCHYRVVSCHYRVVSCSCRVVFMLCHAVSCRAVPYVPRLACPSYPPTAVTRQQAPYKLNTTHAETVRHTRPRAALRLVPRLLACLGFDLSSLQQSYVAYTHVHTHARTHANAHRDPKKRPPQSDLGIEDPSTNRSGLNRRSARTPHDVHLRARPPNRAA
ncbi:hypothetical protein HETIRDRAFT_456196 [Heterobasidion irregulare TC 32-1]|uniref:Uncharacterized protein n=1 Tax=Heterobasidion irregulare (strain TC 32-1) TaxID=747525 RepID=W4JMC6_HETIT|nr:uncharacterized protein HETIRDRAFT_456196 [Heterobasidion irregulare TC 32-1]ETW74619.1 hypothetical protein HETIRDRAFT_456196 [Heterobasidion irregulare TC 32-1]